MFLCFRGLADAHSFDCSAVDLAGYREMINRLKPTHCLCSLRANNAVNRAAIVTESVNSFCAAIVSDVESSLIVPDTSKASLSSSYGSA